MDISANSGGSQRAVRDEKTGSPKYAGPGTVVVHRAGSGRKNASGHAGSAAGSGLLERRS